MHYLDCCPESRKQEVCYISGVYLCCWQIYP